MLQLDQVVYERGVVLLRKLIFQLMAILLIVRDEQIPTLVLANLGKESVDLRVEVRSLKLHGHKEVRLSQLFELDIFEDLGCPVEEEALLFRFFNLRLSNPLNNLELLKLIIE